MDWLNTYNAMDDLDLGIDWLAPIADAAPAGPDLEYDSTFAELEAAAAITPEQQYGDTIIAGKKADWPQVLTLAVRLSRHTRDLRVLLLLTRALTHVYGLPGMLHGLQASVGVLGGFWDSVHPQLQQHDEADPQMRFNALSEFGASDGLVADLRQSLALSTDLGHFTVKDLERLWEAGAIEINTVPVTRAQLAHIVADLETQGVADTLRMPQRILEQLDTMLALCRQHWGESWQPDYAALKRPLQRLSVLFEPPGAESAMTPMEAGHDPAFSGADIPLALTSRADAIRCLKAACKFIEHSEPTNPAPLLIRRAIALMGMNFMDIIKHIAPDGLNQAMFITGVESTDADDR